MARDFNPEDWKTHGPSYRMPANSGHGHSVSMLSKAA
jgi:hypothetical protein